MIVVKSSTARGAALLARAQRHEGTRLYEVYGSYSRDKANAFEYCKEKCAKEHGTDFHICTHCTSNFTVAWKVADGWRMETANNSYHIVVVKEENNG